MRGATLPARVSRERQWKEVGGKVETAAIHRLVEQHAASRPAAIAVADLDRVLTYRELNSRANACARYLMLEGLRRSAHVVVRMPHGADLAIVLLAILKAGGSYSWVDAKGGGRQIGISIAPNGLDRPHTYTTIDAGVALTHTSCQSPNLPILTRGSDVACVLLGDGGDPELFVPHATVVALRRQGIGAADWSGEAGALDLWLVLMAGATASVAAAEHVAAA